MNIEGPSLRDLQANGVHALRRHIARAFCGQPVHTDETPHNAADLIETGERLADRRTLERDVAA